MRTVYDFSVKDRKGKMVSLKEYANEVLLIVNTATRCGFTPQYEELEQLYEKYHQQGFEVLDFPCNQFGQQAPGTDESIHNFCKMPSPSSSSSRSSAALPDGMRATPSTRLSTRPFQQPTPTTSRSPTSSGTSPSSSSIRRARLLPASSPPPSLASSPRRSRSGSRNNRVQLKHRI